MQTVRTFKLSGVYVYTTRSLIHPHMHTATESGMLGRRKRAGSFADFFRSASLASASDWASMVTCNAQS